MIQKTNYLPPLFSTWLTFRSYTDRGANSLTVRARSVQRWTTKEGHDPSVTIHLFSGEIIELEGQWKLHSNRWLALLSAVLFAALILLTLNPDQNDVSPQKVQSNSLPDPTVTHPLPDNKMMLEPVYIPTTNIGLNDGVAAPTTD